MTYDTSPIKYEDVLIKVHNMSFTNDFWDKEPENSTFGVILSKMCIYGADKTKFIGHSEVTANVTLIIRNQSDYSNVVILIGIFSICSLTDFKTSERLFLILTDFLFDKSNEYVKEIKLKGKDNKDFAINKHHYSDGHFANEVHWAN